MEPEHSPWNPLVHTDTNGNSGDIGCTLPPLEDSTLQMMATQAAAQSEIADYAKDWGIETVMRTRLEDEPERSPMKPSLGD